MMSQFTWQQRPLNHLFSMKASQVIATYKVMRGSGKGRKPMVCLEHAPYFGGPWEAAVKSLKTHRNRLERSTVLSNSHPLVSVPGGWNRGPYSSTLLSCMNCH
jgi:hypothetical protein